MNHSFSLLRKPKLVLEFLILMGSSVFCIGSPPLGATDNLPMKEFENYLSFYSSLLLQRPHLAKPYLSKLTLEQELPEDKDRYLQCSFLYNANFAPSTTPTLAAWKALPTRQRYSSATLNALFVAILQKELQRDLPAVTRLAIQAASSSELISTIPILINGLHSPSEEVRLTSLIATLEGNYLEVCPTIQTLLAREPNGYLRSGFIFLLGAFGYTPALPELIERLEAMPINSTSRETFALIHAIASMVEHISRNKYAENISETNHPTSKFLDPIIKRMDRSPKLKCLYIYLLYSRLIPLENIDVMMALCRDDSEEVQRFAFAYLPLFPLSTTTRAHLQKLFLDGSASPNYSIATLAAWGHALLYPKNTPFTSFWWEDRLNTLPPEINLRAFLLSAWMRTPTPPIISQLPSDSILQLNYLRYTSRLRPLSQEEKNLFYQIVQNLLTKNSSGYLTLSAGNDTYEHPYWNWILTPLNPNRGDSNASQLFSPWQVHRALLFLTLFDEMASAQIQGVDQLWITFFKSLTIFQYPLELLRPFERASAETICLLRSIVGPNQSTPAEPQTQMVRLQAAIALLWLEDEGSFQDCLNLIKESFPTLGPKQQELICHLMAQIKPLSALEWLGELLPNSRNHLHLPLTSALVQIAHRGQ